jgi:cytochrome P450
MRLNAHGLALMRISVDETELSGVRIPAGSAVIPAMDAANRDPDEFSDPDSACLGRASNTHLTFGHGPHFCVGAPLARMEMQVAIGTLLRLFPSLRPASPVHQLEWRRSLAGGLSHLPVRLF